MNTPTAINAGQRLFDGWAPSLVSLALRLGIAMIFFQSGLTKISSWETTLALFDGEYQVPLLSPVLAAWLATGAELIFPVLLVAGLLTRFSALALFVLNAVAVLSYPDISEAGVKEHQYWGILLAVLIAYGGGRLALDRLIQRVKEKRLSHVA